MYGHKDSCHRAIGRHRQSLQDELPPARHWTATVRPSKVLGWPLTNVNKIVRTFDLNFFLEAPLPQLPCKRKPLHGHLPNLLKNWHLGHGAVAFWDV